AVQLLPLVRAAPCYPKRGPIRPSRACALARGVALQFFSQNRHTERASLHPLYRTELQNLHDLVYRRAGLERVVDATAFARAIDLHVRGIECDEQELLLFGRKHTFRI